MTNQVTDRAPRKGASTTWIVCAGRTRDVIDSRLRCPRLGVVVVDSCLSCHLMITFEDERGHRGSCSLADSPLRVMM